MSELGLLFLAFNFYQDLANLLMFWSFVCYYLNRFLFSSFRSLSSKSYHFQTKMTENTTSAENSRQGNFKAFTLIIYNSIENKNSRKICRKNEHSNSKFKYCSMKITKIRAIKSTNSKYKRWIQDALIVKIFPIKAHDTSTQYFDILIKKHFDKKIFLIQETVWTEIFNLWTFLF